jgi:glycosyltransferase involved in cell wall biosynthesis
MKGLLKIFWLHPQLREYRKPFFSLMNSDYQVLFFFQQSSDVEHDFAALVSSRNRPVAFEPWAVSWKDIVPLHRHIVGADVVISSFLANCYTYWSLALARFHRKPFVVWEEWMNVSGSKRRYAVRDALCRRLLPFVDCIYTLGPRQESLYAGMGYPGERIFRANEYPGHVFSSIEPDPFDLQVPADSQVVLYLGRLIEVKGIDYLLRAFPAVVRRRDRAVLLIVGDGPEEARLKALAEALGLKNVRFLGSVQDVRQRAFLYRRAGAVVVPSINTGHRSDPGPLVTLEALSAGTAVVISDAVGNCHHVRSGVSGYVVPQKDPAELANAICRCLSGTVGTRPEILEEFDRIPGFAFQKQKMDEAIAKALTRPAATRCRPTLVAGPRAERTGD